MTTNPLSRRSLIAVAVSAIGVLTLALPAPAAAQSYPSKPIVFVVPFAAGSATDQLARALGQSIGEQK